MTPLDLIDRFTEYAGPVLAELLVLGIAITAYQRTRRRSLLLIAISCVTTAVFTIGRFVLDDKASWFWWGLYTVAVNASSVLWVVGSWLLFRHYMRLAPADAQPGASPNCGPAEQVGGSGVAEGPPSVT